MPSRKEKTAAPPNREPGVGKPARAAHGSAAKPKSLDAVTLLERDHREVQGYFDAYDKAKTDKQKAALAEKICHALTVHTRVEEELFYPAARKATGNEDVLDEAAVEHAGAKQLIAEIEAMTVGEDLYDAKIKVLGEQISHHVEEEEKELFPQIGQTDLNLVELGQKMEARKAELMANSKE